MTALASLLLAGGALASLASPSPSLPRGGHLALPVQPLTPRDPQALRGILLRRYPHLAARQENLVASSLGTGTVYAVTLELGTPPQPVPVIIDTGSYELWVNPTCGQSLLPDVCEASARFAPGESETLVELGTGATVDFQRGVAEVDYVTDSVGVGSFEVAQQQFGIATNSTWAPLGVMGIGPYLDGLDGSPYELLIDSLVSQTFIASRAFSLDLRTYDTGGSVLFGAIDTSKYAGALEKVAILPPDEAPDTTNRYWTYLARVGITLPNATHYDLYIASPEPGVPVFFDSGVAVSMLPLPIVEAIAGQFPTAESAEELGEPGMYTVDCAVDDMAGTVDFGFGNKTIEVPYEDFVWHYPLDPSICFLGVMASNGSYTLGAPFMRAAYVVYDQDNRNIHIAQASDCGESIENIGSGVDAVPSMEGLCDYPPVPETVTTTSVSTATSTSVSTVETSDVDTTTVTSTDEPSVATTTVSFTLTVTDGVEATETKTSTAAPVPTAAAGMNVVDPAMGAIMAIAVGVAVA